MTFIVPLPKSIALWFIDNTSLTFEQIAHFTGLHLLEIESLANSETKMALKAMNPIDFGLTTQTLIKESEQDTRRLLDPIPLLKTHTSSHKTKKYTPLAKRMHKPDAIAWLIRHHPELSNQQIIQLIGTTKKMIESIRDKSYWNISNLNPRNPVDLSICTPSELQDATQNALTKIDKATSSKKTL